MGIALEKCLACKAEIPPTHAALHMPNVGSVCCGCENAKLTVYKIEVNGPGNALVLDSRERVLDEVQTLLGEGVAGDSISVEIDEMKVTEFHALPEHGGW